MGWLEEKLLRASSIDRMMAESWVRTIRGWGLPVADETAAAARLTERYRAISLAANAKEAAEAAPFAAAAGMDVVVAGGVIAVVAIYVWAALGSGYVQAREMVRNEHTMSGFSQGFVCGLLRWNYDQTLERFKTGTLKLYHFDESLNELRVTAYMAGLRRGYLGGLAIPKRAARDLLKAYRQRANVHQPSANEWVGHPVAQYSYVIALAGAARGAGMIRAE